MYNDLKKRRRAVKHIAALCEKDFETVLFYLLGDETEREVALKILGDVYPQSPFYSPYVGI